MEWLGILLQIMMSRINRKPAFHGKEAVNSMMLLPSFNFIRGKEIMKLLRNFHLTKVKQNFDLFLRAGAYE